ncbi:phosphoenolpyruvate-protein kinase (PTS system EI component) [Thermanaerovibrio velox DSM 12556]|uniref:Phosphoenolpyruvate-protein phosphotransferase n=1 Tax=Thermanaerovibrio velox DSM 12556 TaxID=926567 RepID=H0UQ90_9BACT|nr:phosphoenolpyruvate--protein phosphotransferase [Thermanaerovibrio velox]EHM10728.1 phosphoenolpyruvate-protein kinase (PTS system EI component) [Thermanaerovibrio velox DSM 12556]
MNSLASSEQLTVKGLPISPGLAKGVILRIHQRPFQQTGAPQVNSEYDKQRFREAQEKAIEQLKALADSTKATLGPEKAAIFDAHQLMIQDPMLVDAILAAIMQGQCLEDAVVEATLSIKAQFDALDDPYFKERAADILDIGQRLFRIITGGEDISQIDDKQDYVIVTDELAPSDAAVLGIKRNVKGVVTAQGGPTSHSAILLKALEIPAVSGIPMDDSFQRGNTILVDGVGGEVILFPSREVEEAFDRRIKAQEETRLRLKELKGKPSVTKDGISVLLFGNIASPKDTQKVLNFGGTGVGLFRTEFLFMGRSDSPSEEEQFQAYSEALKSMAPHPVIIRTLDAGGDKDVPYIKGLVGEEANPFLGLRAIRICMEYREIFMTQLRALARASAFGNLKIMLPMVTSLWEIRTARAMLAEAVLSVKDAGHKVAENIDLGIMIEVPAAAASAHVLAKEVDFFSVGTNDLVQYTLAVDRQNPRLLQWYEPFHPAVIALLENTARAAHEANIELGMCGEMAGDPLALPLLVALGFHELSMSAPRIPWIQDYLMRLTKDRCLELFQKVRSMDSGSSIREELTRFMEEHQG